MAEPLDQHGYPCRSRVVDPCTWFYEQKGGLYLVNEPIEGARTTTIVIPWRKLEAAVDRRRRLKRKAKRV